MEDVYGGMFYPGLQFLKFESSYMGYLYPGFRFLKFKSLDLACIFTLDCSLENSSHLV